MFDFIKRCPNYKRIIAFEPNTVSYNECQIITETQKIRDIKIYNVGLWNERAKLSFLQQKAEGVPEWLTMGWIRFTWIP